MDPDLIADLDPLALKEPSTHAELDPANYGLTIWDLDREFQPEMSADDRARRYDTWQRAVERSLAWETPDR